MISISHIACWLLKNQISLSAFQLKECQDSRANCLIRTEQRSSFSSSSSSESSESSGSGITRVGGRVNMACSYSSSEENSPSPILEDLPVHKRYLPPQKCQGCFKKQWEDKNIYSIRKNIYSNTTTSYLFSERFMWTWFPLNAPAMCLCHKGICREHFLPSDLNSGMGACPTSRSPLVWWKAPALWKGRHTCLPHAQATSVNDKTMTNI